MIPRAVLFDVDGTLAETERDGHRVAFNRAFAEWGLGWYWSEEHYGALLPVTGGRERILHDMALRTDVPAAAAERAALARALHERKNACYAELVAAGGIALRAGVLELMQECRERGVRLGIATTTSRANVAALLEVHLGGNWAAWFDTVVCGEDTRRKKPDPEVYRLAVAALGLAPHETLAVEDSPHGVAAARGAAVPVIVTRSAYFEASDFAGALAIGPSLGTRDGWRPAIAPSCRGERRIGLADIAAWLMREGVAAATA